MSTQGENRLGRKTTSTKTWSSVDGTPVGNNASMQLLIIFSCSSFNYPVRHLRWFNLARLWFINRSFDRSVYIRHCSRYLYAISVTYLINKALLVSLLAIRLLYCRLGNDFLDIYARPCNVIIIITSDMTIMRVLFCSVQIGKVPVRNKVYVVRACAGTTYAVVNLTLYCPEHMK